MLEWLYMPAKEFANDTTVVRKFNKIFTQTRFVQHEKNKDTIMKQTKTTKYLAQMAHTIWGLSAVRR